MCRYEVGILYVIIMNIFSLEQITMNLHDLLLLSMNLRQSHFDQNRNFFVQMVELQQIRERLCKQDWVTGARR